MKEYTEHILISLLITALLLLVVSFAYSANTVTLSWKAPEINVDGTSVVDLAGYKIYYGHLLSDTSPIVLDVGDTQRYTITGLDYPINEYYYAVIVYDTAGNTSSFLGTFSCQSNTINNCIGCGLK